MGRIAKLTLPLLAAAGLMVGSAQANVFKDAWHIVTDPLKLGEASQNALDAIGQFNSLADRVAAHLEALRGNLSEDVQGHFDRVQGLVGEVNTDVASHIDHLDQVIGRRIDELRELEAQIYIDTAKLIDCSLTNAEEEAKRAIADAFNEIADAEPTVYVLWFIPMAKVHVTPQDLRDPLVEWKRLQARDVAYLNSLTDTSDANEIMLTLLKMSHATGRVLCVYRNDNRAVIELSTEQARIDARAEPWTGLTIWSD